MTLEELCEEEPLVKDIFDKADSIDRKELKHLYSMVCDWTFINGNPLAKPSTDIETIDKLNTFLKYIPDNSTPLFFLGMIRLTFMKKDLLEEWISLVNRAYKILSERGTPEIDNEFKGLLEYIEK